MIAPMLPGADLLVKALKEMVDYILVDRMNYNHADWVYAKYKLRDKLSDHFFNRTGHEIADQCMKSGIEYRLVF